MEIEDFEKLMLSGELYYPSDPKLMDYQETFLQKLCAFNATTALEQDKRTAMLTDMFQAFGKGSYIEPPLHANWAGKHVSFGKSVYANFNLTLVDDGEITVGDCTMIAPNVTITTATHPISPRLREKGYQYNLPVHIGKNCWIGAGTIILPGVSIGDNTVIGAGSLVNHDIPANMVAYGTPCRVMRAITEEDERFYNHGKPIKV